MIFACLVSGGAWNHAVAQNERAGNQPDSTASTATAPNSAPRSESAARPDNGPREMPVFFIIGIAINAIMMLLFAAWFVSEWKKQNKEHVGKKQE